MNFYFKDKDILDAINHIRTQEQEMTCVEGLNDFIELHKDNENLYDILLNLSYILSNIEMMFRYDSGFILFLSQDKFYIVYDKYFTLYKTIYKLNRNENKFEFYKELTLDYILNEENKNI